MNRSSPFPVQRSRSMPTERMLRTICVSDSSKAKYSVRSPRLHAALAKDAETVVFPVPEVPDTRMLLPRKQPFPPSISSSAGMPVLTRSRDAVCARPSEVIGSTEMPSSSIRKGYSLVPCVEPRYFTTLTRRVDTWLTTRWSSRITQSETYSSSPWRVRVASPRSPVITAVMPRSFSH